MSIDLATIFEQRRTARDNVAEELLATAPKARADAEIRLTRPQLTIRVECYLAVPLDLTPDAVEGRQCF